MRKSYTKGWAITPIEMAKRYIGMKEIPGPEFNPAILAMLKLDSEWPEDDEVPWCSAFMNWIFWHFKDLPRSKSLMARSWLNVGISVMNQPVIGDIIIIKRGGGNQPGPDVTNAPGHVGFFIEYIGDSVMILGANQSDSVNVSSFSRNRILDIREPSERI